MIGGEDTGKRMLLQIPVFIESGYRQEKMNAFQQFNKDGYAVLENVLTQAQIDSVNAAIDRHMDEHPEDVCCFNPGHTDISTPHKYSDAFDFLIEHPATLNLLNEILGEDLAFEEISSIIRDPTTDLEEFKGWHRDLIRDYERRHEIPYISCVFYLTDVGEQDHCLAIIPGTHDRLIDTDPKDCAPDAGVDIIASAGTAVVFHGRCIHAGRLKSLSRQRRSVHIYYGRAGQPRTTEWTYFPERLREKEDPKLPPKLYKKWNEKRVIDGVGKIPDGIDRSLSISEIVREIQTRAKPQ